MNEPALRALLAEAGLRVTRPRLAVLQALASQAQPVDAMWLHRRLRDHEARIGLGTVYRALRDLERLALASVSATPHGRLRWRLAAPPPSLPALPADASLPGSTAVAALAEQAARLGYHLVPMAHAAGTVLPQETP
ncbi:MULTISPECIES: Fur family transcriptional regulator [Gammaproteobacteria]|uniref:Fur family transcriptional regulator n=1 Tax=Gammaproteobacteria TaxID=1236 RepID=UPI00112CD538|nr:transcriptional repressor [Pseudomonas sp. Hp2]